MCHKALDSMQEQEASGLGTLHPSLQDIDCFTCIAQINFMRLRREDAIRHGTIVILRAVRLATGAYRATLPGQLKPRHDFTRPFFEVCERLPLASFARLSFHSRMESLDHTSARTSQTPSDRP